MTFKNLALTIATTLALAPAVFAGAAQAAEGGAEIENVDFSFDGIFGAYDRNQLQRGLQVYTEVCSACHGLKYVPLRTLHDEGGPQLPEDQVRAYAAQFEIFDPELDDTRPRTPNDPFPGSGLPGAPDLSLMAKARAGFSGPYGLGLNQLTKGMGGPEYISALLQGYTGEEKEEAGVTLYENKVFPGGWIAMAPPLAGDDVTYADEHENTLEAESHDIAAFLRWTAEPHQNGRKYVGFVAVVFLSLLAVLLYLTNKKLWAPIKTRRRDL